MNFFSVFPSPHLETFGLGVPESEVIHTLIGHKQKKKQKKSGDWKPRVRKMVEIPAMTWQRCSQNVLEKMKKTNHALDMYLGSL